MPSPTNVRFPEHLNRGLSQFARQTGSKKSTVVVSAVDEWLRMQAHPGIIFRTTTTGQRRAALAVGPEVWTIAESWAQHDTHSRSAEVVADALGLTVHDVETAMSYWADHREEIDELITRHHAAQDEALAAWERRRALDAL